MTRARLSQLFALCAMICMIVAAFVLQPPNSGTLRKAYIIHARSVERIADPISQWSNAYAFQLIAGDGTSAKLGLAMMLAGGLLLGLALHINRHVSLNLGKATPPLYVVESGPGGEDAAPDSVYAEGSRVGYLRLIIGLLSVAVVTERNGNLFKIAVLQDLNIHMQASLLFFGIVLITSALIGNPAFWKSDRGLRAVFSFPKLTKTQWIEIIAVSAMTVLALILRTWRLGGAIHGLIDEAHFINAITLLWEYPDDIRLLQPFSTIPAFPWVYPYMQGGPVEVFGNNLTGIRVLSMVMGTATIPLLYLLARSFFDRPTALTAALILATFPPHVHFSRAGINNIADPLVGTAALAFLAYGFRTRQRWAFVLGGVSLGLTQYFYDGGRLLYPALTLIWLILAGLISLVSQSPRTSHREGSTPPRDAVKWGPGGKERFHRLWPKLLIFLLAFLLIAAPIYYTRYGQASGFSSRAQDVRAGNDFWRSVLLGDSGELIYLRHLAYTFFIYVYMPEMSWFYGGDTPLILHLFVPLFLLGLFWALWNWRQSGPLLLILWLLMVAFGNTLLRESATSARYVVLFPALALLMALGLRQSVALLLADLWPKRAQYALIALIVIGVAVGQTGYYFDRHIDTWNNSRLALDADDAMFRAADLPPNTHVHIVNEIEIMRFNLDTMRRFLHRTDLDVIALYPDRFTRFYLDGLPQDVPHAFFLPPGRPDLVALIINYFELDPPQYSPYDIPREFQFVLYFAPARFSNDHPGELVRIVDDSME